MRIAVFGLGYVGSVAAACLAARGHRVIGVDPSREKVDSLRAGRAPVVEPGLDDLVRAGVGAGRLSATTDAEAVAEAEVSIVAVGTPGDAGGRADLAQLERCLKEIGRALRRSVGRHVVVVRSTVPPGTMTDEVRPWLEVTSGRQIGRQLGLCHQPEFLREGQALADHGAPAHNVIAASDDASFDLVAGLEPEVATPPVRTDFATAELLKYADNAWHATKVAFANEIGSLAKVEGVDGQALMALFCQDVTLNLSAAYLVPGQGFGGACLPKDLRALGQVARATDLAVPLLDAVLESNRHQVERVAAAVLAHPVRRIGVLGLAFKPGTDDLRESPMVAVIERLIAEGCAVRAFDPAVRPAAMVGANRAFALARLPQLGELVAADLDGVLDHAELLLIGHVDPALAARIGARAGDRRIVDCQGLAALRHLPGYEGISW